MAHEETESTTSEASSRRNLMKGLLGFSILATLGGVLTPIVGYLWPPARRAGVEGSRVRVASLTELQVAGGMVVPVESRPIVLTVTDEGEVHAFSAICTHLACVVTWETAGDYILCPCHDGRFNAQTGAVISGPPPAPLPAVQVAVSGDDVLVTL